MGNIYGDNPYSQTTKNGPTINDLLYRQRPENTTGGHPDPVGEQGPIGPIGVPHCGKVGWICPVCGRGLSPLTAYCPCKTTAYTPPSFTDEGGKTTYIASGKKKYQAFEFEF